MNSLRHAILKVLFSVLICGYTHLVMAHVALDYPQGGETFVEEQTVTIQWHIVAVHVTLNWDLYFSSDGGDNWVPIELDIHPDSLSYTWHVPSIFTSQGRIRIIQDNADQNYLDFSMDFNIVPDTSPPMLDIPASNLIIPCDMGNPEAILQTWLNNHGGALVTHHCDPLIWTNDFTQLDHHCGVTGDAFVTFTATDDCGSVFTVASVTIIDISPPVMDVLPVNRNVECDGHGNIPEFNSWLLQNGGAHATDACGGVTWSFENSTPQQQCGSSGSTIATFIVTDVCGNSASATASFIISDHVAPEITIHAQDLVIECDSSNGQIIHQWLENHGQAQAIDMCGSVQWVNDYLALNNTCGAAGNAVINFTASDECGNTAFTTAMLRVEDHVAPVIYQSALDNTIHCGAFNPEGLIQGWIELQGGAQADDFCGMISWTNDFAGLSDECGISGRSVVTFTAADECGNTSTSMAIISLLDTIAPIMDMEARDTAIACGSPDQEMIIQQWLDRHGGAGAHDDCGDITWSDDFPDVPVSCDTTTSYMVTFTVMDECQNSKVTTATFTIMAETSADHIQIPENIISLYPNPVQDFLTLDLSDRVTLPIHVALFDLIGKRVWNAELSKERISIPVSQYNPGVYFIRIEIGGKIFSRIVIKQ